MWLRSMLQVPRARDLVSVGELGLLVLPLLLAWASAGGNHVFVFGPAAAGRVRLIRRTEPAFDAYTTGPAPTRQAWLRQHFFRMAVFSPYWDDKLRWYPEADVYRDLYAIYTSSEVAVQHPEWILQDGNGTKLYIPWGCERGTCPQYAADVTSPAFRQWWISEAAVLLNKGYRGLWIDDVNMEFRICDGRGTFTAPVDPNTGAPMTWAHWREYVARFVAEIRAAFPNIEIIHNSIWFAGPLGIRDRDSQIQSQIAAANLLNIEFGVNDPNLTGGTGEWSLNALLAYIDRLHVANRGAIVDSVPAGGPGAEYALANYYLISNGSDALSSQAVNPDNWWPGFDTHLGRPLGPRTVWHGLMRRDFTGGMVLVNAPQNPTIRLILPAIYRDLKNAAVTEVTLPERHGAVLLSGTAGPFRVPPPVRRVEPQD